jgi:hypothetical protein
MSSRWSRAAGPEPSDATPCEAAALFRSFHRFGPGQVIRMPHPRRMPVVLVHLGWLQGLIYSSDRGSPGRPRRFIHFLETPARLTCDPLGEQLYVLGGRYRVTHRGIEG